jgi:oligopeptide/dipeptide ABC transporter ATP-binding protein
MWDAADLHDLAIIRHVAHRTAVMYLGVVETAPTAQLWSAPMHPYTQALIDAIPHAVRRTPPVALTGEIPDPARPPSGCRFHPRCPHVMDRRYGHPSAGGERRRPARRLLLQRIRSSRNGLPGWRRESALRAVDPAGQSTPSPGTKGDTSGSGWGGHGSQ